ncbi:SRPBCC family protein [Shivajiella indica]|uniref:SRPBCC domain-containing protein n=1 Tax=Shivajiella indica TaxID=872115 RepID=A0ABW5B4Z8_9BACT
MEKLKFSITINAPKEKVWDIMLGEETYPKWTEVFMPGSYFDGDWSEGSKILFLAPDGRGNTSGMVSKIKANKQYNFISIEHLGFIENGKEDTSSEAVKSWAGALENYTFEEKGESTKVLVELDSTEEHKEMFENTWNEALKILKRITEG